MAKKVRITRNDPRGNVFDVRYFCLACNSSVGANDNYCPVCGKEFTEYEVRGK